MIWPKFTWCRSIIKMVWEICHLAATSNLKKESKSPVMASGARYLQMRCKEMINCRQWCKVRKISINRINRCNNKWTTTRVRMPPICNLNWPHCSSKMFRVIRSLWRWKSSKSDAATKTIPNRWLIVILPVDQEASLYLKMKEGRAKTPFEMTFSKQA